MTRNNFLQLENLTNMRDLKYLLAYTAPLLVLAGLYWQGAWTWGLAIETFAVIPILETLIPASAKNFSTEEEEKLSKRRFFDWLLYLHVPLVYGLLWIFFTKVKTAAFSPAELVGMTFSVGILVGAFGINVGHELGHRSNRREQFLAKFLLLPALYQHFYIEHNRGHHRHVATDADPASARLGEPVYAFWLKSVVKGYLHAWQIEAERLHKVGHTAWSWRNEMMRFQAAQLAYLGAVFAIFGWAGLLAAVVAAVIGILLLETVNYIEHYGLRRKLLPTGRYEPVSSRHSWNSDHELGRIFLYELTRHSDHHYRASRKYQVLRHFDESPQLPFGYPVAIVLALLPPLWFRIMDAEVARVTSIGLLPSG
jgi:alkane 1-monooxygenase